MTAICRWMSRPSDPFWLNAAQHARTIGPTWRRMARVRVMTAPIPRSRRMVTAISKWRLNGADAIRLPPGLVAFPFPTMPISAVAMDCDLQPMPS